MGQFKELKNEVMDLFNNGIWTKFYTKADLKP